MRLTTQNILLIGGLAIVAYIVYKKLNPINYPGSPLGHSTAGTGNSVSAATHQGAQGSTDFWTQLGNAGKGLNSAVSSVESTYNSVYDLFGNSDTSTNTGQGNNGTAG